MSIHSTALRSGISRLRTTQRTKKIRNNKKGNEKGGGAIALIGVAKACYNSRMTNTPPEKNHLVLIDALNVIRSNLPLARMEEREGSPAVVDHFVSLCMRVRPANEQWVVVFDGPDGPNAAAHRDEGIEVLFSGALQADDLIVDRARYALSQGRSVTVASSDAALAEQGATILSAYDFFDLLATRPRPATPEATPKMEPLALLDGLIRAGHLPPGYTPPDSLARQIEQVLDYYGEILADKANKAAARIQRLLYESAPLAPRPDPEKAVVRSLKQMLRKAPLKD